jgi:tRNA dimethylallyltransferase
MSMGRPPVVVLTGPTASGKSEMAMEIARWCGAEIVSADSMQVYRYMDIGTAKPSRAEQREVRHHLIDVCEPNRRFTVSDYQRLATEAIAGIHARGNLPLVVGGTGFYIDALLLSFDLPAGDEEHRVRSRLLQRARLEGSDALYRELLSVDPDSAARIHPNDKRRIIRALEVYIVTGKPMSALMRKGEPRYTSAMFTLDVERDHLYRRIDDRVDSQIANGLISEVARLLERYGDSLATARQAIGYKEIIDYLERRVRLPEAIETLKRNTRRYAKRQMTWFRRKGAIEWLPATTDDERKHAIGRLTEVVEGILQNPIE